MVINMSFEIRTKFQLKNMLDINGSTKFYSLLLQPHFFWLCRLTKLLRKPRNSRTAGLNIKSSYIWVTESIWSSYCLVCCHSQFDTKQPCPVYLFSDKLCRKLPMVNPAWPTLKSMHHAIRYLTHDLAPSGQVLWVPFIFWFGIKSFLRYEHSLVTFHSIPDRNQRLTFHWLGLISITESGRFVVTRLADFAKNLIRLFTVEYAYPLHLGTVCG